MPIVFNVGVDPVKAGLVVALNKPGGNITGITSVNNQLGTKKSTDCWRALLDGYNDDDRRG